MSEQVEEKELRIADLNYPAEPDRHDVGHIGGLAESIVLCGLLHPIAVHPAGDGRYDVDSGTGRIHAHLLLGKKRIRARIFPNQADYNRLRHIDENLYRVETSAFERDKFIAERRDVIIPRVDPKGKALQGCFDSYEDTVPRTDAARQKPTVEQLANAICVPKRTVEKSLSRMHNATPEVLGMYESEELRQKQVDELIRISDPVVQAEVAAEAVGKSVAATRQLVKAILDREQIPAADQDEPGQEVTRVDAYVPDVVEPATTPDMGDSNRYERLRHVKALARELRGPLAALWTNDDRLAVLEELGVCANCGAVIEDGPCAPQHDCIHADAP